MRRESLHGSESVDAHVESVLVVVSQEIWQGARSGDGREIRAGVGPFPQTGADEAFGLAVGLRPIGPGPVVPESQPATEKSVVVDVILAENADGRRWADVSFEGVRSVHLTENVALLTYRVTARWEHKESRYPALASSVYVKREGAWKLAFHQQSPLGAM